MSQMKELYEKVSKDEVLQSKFTEIMKDAENAGQEATQEKLTAFAEAAGYHVTTEEMLVFFKDLTEQNDGELSDTELDMVAGGKTTLYTVLNIGTLGGMALLSALNQAYDCENVDLALKK